MSDHLLLPLRVIGQDEPGDLPPPQGESEACALSRSGCPRIVETPPGSLEGWCLTATQGHPKAQLCLRTPTATSSEEELPWRVARAVASFHFL